MNTEITGINARSGGWVFYDAECRFCVAGMERLSGMFGRRGFTWLPLQTPGTSARLGVTETQLYEAMWLQTTDGRTLGGLDAWILLMRRVAWLWPLAVLLTVPGINSIGRVLYRWLARNRYCLGGNCKLRTHPPTGLRARDLLLLGLLIVAVVWWGRTWPAWVLMWALAVTLGEFCKWMTWRDARSLGLPTPLMKTLCWFLLWPGMDGRAFFRNTRRAEPATVIRPTLGEWSAALLKCALGCMLLWYIGPRYFAAQPLALGWCGMVGLILVLHFGLFHLLSLAWRMRGAQAAPIMHRPLLATSLAQLWGERWNTAFSIPARRFLLLPLARKIGLNAAGLLVFAASGLMHELVISVPARGGYGLPTAYFLLQGAGVWLERTKAGRVLGLGAGVGGWLWTLLFAALPAFWLFHPPFVRNVILPMLHAVGAH